MEKLSEEGLKSLLYRELVDLLKRYARDNKENMIVRLLRFSIHSKNIATIEEEYSNNKIAIEQAESIEALGKIDDRIIMDTIN